MNSPYVLSALSGTLVGVIFLSWQVFLRVIKPNHDHAGSTGSLFPAFFTKGKNNPDDDDQVPGQIEWSHNGWGGSQWQAGSLKATPKTFKRARVPKVIVQPVEEETEEEEEEIDGVETIAGRRYGRVELILFVDESGHSTWIPYVPAPIVYKAAKLRRRNYLFLLKNKRSHPQAEPSLRVALYDQTLIQTLRTIHGLKEYFGNFNPEIPIKTMFKDLNYMKRKLVEVQTQASQQAVTTELREFADSYGIQHALEPGFADQDVLQCLASVADDFGELVHCLDTEFEPIRQQIAMYLTHGHITFELLRYVFEPGQEVHYIEDGDVVAFVVREAEYKHVGQDTIFSLQGRGWEWNGHSYVRDERDVSVNEWTGTRALSSLPFGHIGSDLKAELEERGKLYVQYAPHILYVYTSRASGMGLPKGRAMVDTSRRPSYEASSGGWGAPEVSWVAPANSAGWGEPPEQSPPARWTRHHKGKAVVKVNEMPLNKHNDEAESADDLLLHLLPATVYGFSFVSKAFGLLHVTDLGPVKFDEKAWDHLVLDSDSKLLIKSLVEVTQASTAGTALITDVITGKGGGLVGVLHGAPGTGKTLTAEAVAEHLRRPLYMVSAGELSLNAAKLETDFRKILERATEWNAVLLIDEADVFLEQRSYSELHRNSIVSVTLRLLEYHRGVLFLTTNRITAFDEAFLSRFSLAIRYPDLDIDKRRIIWTRFLALAGVTETPEDGKPYVSVDDIERLAAKAFNGRTVKNLVRTAQALALAEKAPLSIKHIDVVARISEKFLEDFSSMRHGESYVEHLQTA